MKTTFDQTLYRLEIPREFSFWGFISLIELLLHSEDSSLRSLSSLSSVMSLIWIGSLSRVSSLSIFEVSAISAFSTLSALSTHWTLSPLSALSTWQWVFLNSSQNFWSFDTPDTPGCASAVIWNRFEPFLLQCNVHLSLNTQFFSGWYVLFPKVRFFYFFLLVHLPFFAWYGFFAARIYLESRAFFFEVYLARMKKKMQERWRMPNAFSHFLIIQASIWVQIKNDKIKRIL